MVVEYEEWELDPQILAVVNKELDRLKDTIEFVHPADGEDKYGQWIERIEASPYPAGCARLRLDWELVDQPKILGDEHVLDRMFQFVAIDIADLLENGDTSNHTDPLFQALDGKNKLGKELLSIHIPSAVIYKEYKPSKESTEFTFYLLLVPKWS